MFFVCVHHDHHRSHSCRPDYLGDPANRSGGFCTSHAMDSKDVQELLSLGSVFNCPCAENEIMSIGVCAAQGGLYYLSRNPVSCAIESLPNPRGRRMFANPLNFCRNKMRTSSCLRSCSGVRHISEDEEFRVWSLAFRV